MHKALTAQLRTLLLANNCVHTFVKVALRIRYAGPPSCCCIAKQHFYNYLKSYEFL